MTSMPISFYMDHHVPKAITLGLRKRGVNVITAYEDQAAQMDDPVLLDRATQLKRILFTQDEDFLREGAKRLANGIYFVGIVYGHQELSIGDCIRDLEVIAKAGASHEFENRVEYLPL